MSKRALFIGTWVCLVLLSFVPAVHAVTPSVSPNEGTIGTTFAISGEHFGMKRGTVFIGSKPCQVLEWGDSAITCLINVPIRPGSYDVSVNLHGRPHRVILPKAFAIRAPELDPPTHRPHFVSPGDVVTLTGMFFGDGHGRHQVEIANLRGDKKLCRILNWAMNSITFELPHHGIPGIFHLRVINAAGSDTQPWWGTFAKPPTNPPNLLGSYSGMITHDNASAVAYNGKLYAFYPEVNDDKNYIAYRTTPDGTTWSSGSYLETGDASKVKQRSKAQINPLVADEILYVFYTGIDGKLYYLKLDFVAPEDEIVPDPEADPQTVQKIWQPAQAIPDAQVQDTGGRFAAVYNFTKKWIEIYWTPDSVNVYMKTYTVATRTWSDTTPVTLPRTNTFIAPYLTAVFNQLEEGDYVTYISYADGSAGYLAELKDGEVRQPPITSSTWKSVDPNRGPSLADLGNDYLTVIYNRRSDRSYYQKYDKNTRTVFSQEFSTFVSEQDTAWAPTGITFSNEVVDEESPTGLRMDTNFYVFVGNNPSGPLTDTRWQFVKCEHVGYWMPTSNEGTEVSFGNFLTDTFELWPIVGVVDMPPYVENGKECLIKDECDSDVEYSFQKIVENGMSVEGSAGMYVRTRARSPVEMSMSGGYTGGYEDSTTVTLTQGDPLTAGRDGTIIAYYYVPTFTLTTLEWHDSNTLDTTNGLQTESAKVTGAEIRKEAFNPIDGPPEWQSYWEAKSPGVLRPPYLEPAVFPCHESEVIDPDTKQERPESDLERLLTYCKDTTNYKKVASGTAGWAKDSPGYFEWEISKEHSNSNGFYIDMKIGVKGKVAAGAEGSFKLLMKSKTAYQVQALTNIRGPKEYDSDPRRIASYHLEGYWLKPNKNVYWVPEYRKTAGDQPWFITYRVKDGFWQGSPTTSSPDKPVPIPFTVLPCP